MSAHQGSAAAQVPYRTQEHPWTYSPEFFLKDDLVLSFNVVETKSGEYGVELYIAQGRKARDFMNRRSR
jgi:hypothetical protein